MLSACRLYGIQQRIWPMECRWCTNASRIKHEHEPISTSQIESSYERPMPCFCLRLQHRRCVSRVLGLSDTRIIMAGLFKHTTVKDHTHIMTLSCSHSQNDIDCGCTHYPHPDTSAKRQAWIWTISQFTRFSQKHAQNLNPALGPKLWIMKSQSLRWKKAVDRRPLSSYICHVVRRCLTQHPVF